MHTDFIGLNDLTPFPESYQQQMSQKKPGFSVHNAVFGVSHDFTRLKMDFSMIEIKVLAYALTEVDFTKPMLDSIVIDKKALARELGWKEDSSHRSVKLRKSLEKMAEHGKAVLRNERWEESNETVTLIDSVDFSSLREKIIIRFTEESKRFFGNLHNGDFITIKTSDVFNMKHKRAFIFYMFLRRYSDSRDESNDTWLSTKLIKDMFSMPIEAYMRKEKGFNRSQFEHKVLDHICDDIKKCKMIQLIPIGEGKAYEKIKDDFSFRIRGYGFRWSLDSGVVDSGVVDSGIVSSGVGSSGIVNSGVGSSDVGDWDEPYEIPHDEEPMSEDVERNLEEVEQRYLDFEDDGAMEETSTIQESDNLPTPKKYNYPDYDEELMERFS